MKSNCATHASWPFLNFVVGHMHSLKHAGYSDDEMMRRGRRGIARNTNLPPRLQMEPRASATSSSLLLPPFRHPRRPLVVPINRARFISVRAHKWYSSLFLIILPGCYSIMSITCPWDRRIRKTMEMGTKAAAICYVTCKYACKVLISYDIASSNYTTISNLKFAQGRGFKGSNSRNWIYIITVYIDRTAR